MLISTEFLLSLLVALGIGKYSNHVSPDYYTMITEQGKEYNLKIDTKHNRPCPIHCGADHFHSVLLLDEKSEADYYHYNMIGFESSKVFVNSEAIVDIESVDMSSNDKPEKLKMINVQTYLPFFK